MNTSESNKSPLGAVVASLTPDPKGAKQDGMLGTEASFRSSSYPHKSASNVAPAPKPAAPVAPSPASQGTVPTGPATTGAPSNAPAGAPGARRGRSRPISRMKRPEHRRVRLSSSQPLTKRENEIPPVAPGNIRIIPLGGVEEVGKNMTVVEIGNDIIVIDAGFQFKEEGTPGIDYILPNTRYLEERKDRVKAMIVSHGHLDHIGGIPFIMDRIGNPPVYTRNLTALMLKKRQAEFPHVPALDFKIVEKNDKVQIGNLIVRFFGVTHTIPDSMGIIIETPFGNIVTPGDFKLEHVEGVPTEREEKEYAMFDKEKTLLLMSDSTNVANPGFSTPEKLVHKNLDEIIKNIKGRLIVGLFASQLERIIQIIKSAENYNKKVVIEGRSMKTNVEIAQMANLLGDIKKETIIDSRDMDKYPPDRIIVLATGAQGDEFAALMRMSVKNYKYLQLNKKDTVLLSSSIVPGNEKSVQKLKDNLSRQGAKIIEFRTSDVYIHSTGHGNREEVLWLHRKVKPKFFMPMHGSHYMLRLHADVAMEVGMPEDHIIVPDDGSILEIQEGGTKFVMLDKKAPSQTVTVDGFTVGDMQEVVMRDRQILSQDGIFVIFALLDQKTGKIRQSPDIISRGSVYLQESQDILREVRFIIKRSIERNINIGGAPRGGMNGGNNTAPQSRNDSDGNNINFDYVKNIVNDEVGRFLFQETAKKPIIITVIRTV